MKVISKEIKECTNLDDSKTTVLELIYSHKGETGKILVKDYNDENYDVILKALRIQVRNTYNLIKNIGA